MHYDTRLSSRAKRISIRIDPSARVVVTAPKRTSIKTIQRFVEEQTDWIKKHQAKIKQKINLVESDEQIQIFGKIYQKKLQFETGLPMGIFVKNNELVFNYPHASLNKKKFLQAELELFLKKTARNYLLKQTKNLSEKMKVSYHNLTLRNQRTRWGSCSSNDNLSLNWRLVHYPPEIIDYVIIHELAHLTHHNHSQKFWRCVAEFDPDFKLHRSYLKKHGVSFA